MWFRFGVVSCVGSENILDVGVDVAFFVTAGVGMVVERKGRRKVTEGLSDSACDQWVIVSGSTVFPSADANSKAADQSCFCRALKPK